MVETEFKSYLAANVLSEDRVITYRFLSRALKVHVNVAKEMLYEFHRVQNGKKPGSIHAVYLVAGTRRNPSPIIVDGNAARDGPVQSSPYRGSPNLSTGNALNDSPLFSVTLVRESDLQGLRSHYEAITSIHIYSIALRPLMDLQILSGGEIKNKYAGIVAEDGCSIYGTVVNKCMRRFKGMRPSPLVVTVDAQALERTPHFQNGRVDESSISTISSLGRLSSKSQPRARSSSSSGTNDKSSQERINASNPPQLGRDSSSIFKSFAKTKPKLSREILDRSPSVLELDPATPGGVEDETYTSEDEESYVPPAQASSSEGTLGAHRKSLIERAAALKKMMDEDDLTQGRKHAVTRMESQVLVEQALAGQSIEVAKIIGGRRRGRKMVLKKKTTKDEDGYLITIEEPGWESFSEDETVAAKSKASSFSTTSEMSKKGPSRPGQGSIMSFFGKK